MLDLRLSLIPATRHLAYGWGMEAWFGDRLLCERFGALFGLHEAEAAAELLLKTRQEIRDHLRDVEPPIPARVVTDNLAVCELCTVLAENGPRTVDLLPTGVGYPLTMGAGLFEIREVKLVSRNELSASALAAYGVIRANGKLDPRDADEVRLVEVLKEVMDQVLAPAESEAEKTGMVMSGCYGAFARALEVLAEYGEVEILRKKGRNVTAKLNRSRFRS
ncbi:hypothetical protein [Thermosulfurimonas sp. F29]|uniref:hypothetical protein n=1 Tax=Thermosulfurimonas sp. F29 TaxID=2867247 RepID=UPI001C8305F9|nr:hypothetical protein [Thermosulfurimonas sp. F29]MBX6424147.1 hypothetical protein [Thermosulfurimonas sp. F29]